MKLWNLTLKILIYILNKCNTFGVTRMHIKYALFFGWSRQPRKTLMSITSLFNLANPGMYDETLFKKREIW